MLAIIHIIFWLAVKIDRDIVGREARNVIECDEMWFCSTHHPISVFRCLLIYSIFVAGTFARVCLCRERNSRDYFALKILAIHDVIRLKQVEHVKNEKNILKVSGQTFNNREKSLIQQRNLGGSYLLSVIQTQSSFISR